MSPRSSLDVVEILMSFDEAFGTEVPLDDAGSLDSPGKIVDRLELHLSNERPNKDAAALLKKLAKDQGRPELAEGLEGTWRREQIAAIIREIVR